MFADGLALAGNAPRVFAKVSKSGLPYVSVIFCSCFSALAFMSVSSGSGRVFGWFANMVSFVHRCKVVLIVLQTAVAGLMTWFGICVTYIRFYSGLKAQGIDRSTLPFMSKLQPYAAWYAMVFCLLICFVSILVVCVLFLTVCAVFWVEGVFEG